jgi:hypothetical protein
MDKIDDGIRTELCGPKFIGYGTGSNPPEQNGWHLNNRFMPKTNPRKIPFFWIAWYI